MQVAMCLYMLVCLGVKSCPTTSRKTHCYWLCNMCAGRAGAGGDNNNDAEDEEEDAGTAGKGRVQCTRWGHASSTVSAWTSTIYCVRRCVARNSLLLIVQCACRQGWCKLRPLVRGRLHGGKRLAKDGTSAGLMSLSLPLDPDFRRTTKE